MLTSPYSLAVLSKDSTNNINKTIHALKGELVQAIPNFRFGVYFVIISKVVFLHFSVDLKRFDKKKSVPIS